MNRRNGTDGSLLASLPWSLAALAVALLPHLPYIPPWISVAFALCAGGRWLIELRRWRLPPAWLRVVLSLICFVGVIATYGAISGVGPGSALLVVMAALKLMETRRRRDQFVLLFIAIFLVMASLLREQYLWSLPYLVAALLVTMTAWLQMSLGAAAEVRASFANSARLLLYAAPLAVAMWVFFPRIATPFWSVPIDTGTARSGLSGTMSPGDVSSLSLSNDVAFRVRFDSDIPPPPQRYWRGLVLYHFNGSSWRGREPAPDRRARERIDVAGDPVAYQVTLEPTQQHWVFALDMPYHWSLDDKTYMGPQQQLAHTTPIDQRIIYEAVSYPEYRVARDFGRVPRDWYTYLPQGSNPRTVELARELRAQSPSDAAYLGRVLDPFRREAFFYTLQPPELGANPVDQFLFETRRGFCEHYASAFAVLMRAAGIPARVVLGYQGGELNPMGEYLIVRQSDAHAWTEVWLRGRGWLRVDPTAAVAPERIEAGMSGAMLDGSGSLWGLGAPSLWLHRMTLVWDALNARWNEWILGYGPENQLRFLSWLGMDDPTWRKQILTMLALLLLLIGAISLLLVWRYRPPRRDPAAALYARFTRKAGAPPRLGETPLRYAARLAARPAAKTAHIATVTDTYLATRYGPAGDDALASLEAAVDAYARAAGTPTRIARRLQFRRTAR